MPVINLSRFLVQFVVVMLAWIVCWSRVMDHKHYWSDVSAGAAIGALVAIFTVSTCLWGAVWGGTGFVSSIVAFSGCKSGGYSFVPGAFRDESISDGSVGGRDVSLIRGSWRKEVWQYGESLLKRLEPSVPCPGLRNASAIARCRWYFYSVV